MSLLARIVIEIHGSLHDFDIDAEDNIQDAGEKATELVGRLLDAGGHRFEVRDFESVSTDS